MIDIMSIDLIYGDCLKELPRIIKNLKDRFIIVTDPPFNIDYHYNDYQDNLEEGAYYEMLGNIFQYGQFVIIHYPEEIYRLAFQMGIFPEKIVSWVYNSNTAKQHKDIAFFGIKPDFRKYGQEYKNPTDKRIAKRIANGEKARLYDWWNINQVKNVSKEKSKHPCQMPIEVMRRIVGILPEDYTIVDPFMGSGSTGIACKQLNRNFIGIEIDKEYFEIAETRISNLIVQENLFG
jgi:DNA modification methylase